MGSGAMDRPQPPSGHQGKRLGNQRYGYDCRRRYCGPIHGSVGRKETGLYRSRPEDGDGHPGRQAGLDRIGIYV
jgi:hypothetical protein